jgi:biotin synthase
MMMHDYDLNRFIECIKIVKNALRGSTKIISNVGDTSYDAFVQMKEAGLDAVYHCWRLGEGKDTKLSPESRKQTILNAKMAGLEVLDALEPIGIEHTPEEMAEHIFFSKEMNVLQTGAMKRTNVPCTPFEGMKEISSYALSKIEAVPVLCFASMDRMPIMGVHEPNLISFLSGANMITAETGVNPRDVAVDTKYGRGFDVERCKTLLKEAGFTKLILGDGSTKDI